MDLRLAVYQLAENHQLDAQQTRQLQQLAGFGQEPARLAWWLPRGVAVLGAALLGLGLICWVAANWDDFGRNGRFALLQGIFVAACLGAFAAPKARSPLLLIAMLAIGGLFAYFGQTYQTGADPWQLFAVWAALALPLCLVARSDVLWAPWMLVLATGITLWIQAHAYLSWHVDPADLDLFLLGWLALLTGCAVVSPPLARWTGAGQWSLRLGLMLLMISIVGAGIGALFMASVGMLYWSGLGILLIAGLLLQSRPLFDVFSLSAVALGLNVLIVAGVASQVFDTSDDPVAGLVMTGLVAAMLLAASAKLILWRAREAA